MVDQDWRAFERIWKADPGDQDALQRAVAARRRAGVPVPGWMLERQIFTERRFRSELPLSVAVQLPDGRTREVGRTPGSLTIPEHRAWWVQPEGPTDASLARIADDPIIRATIPGLSLRPDVSDAGLEAMKSFSVLTRLDLAGCTRVTRLTSNPSLETLDLWSCRGVTDAGLAPLAGLGALTSLNLRGCSRLTDAGLAHLSGLGELHSLSVGACPLVTDAGLAHLGNLRHLTALDLSECPALTDAGLEHLASREELTILNVSRCPKLTARGLETLGALANLSQLYVLGCGPASARAEKVLAALLPRCTVISAPPP